MAAYDVFPHGFFDRADEAPDDAFYAIERFVTHIDETAIAAVEELYDELHLSGDVLDICSSWVSHFRTPPRRLVAMDMNEAELRANTAASANRCFPTTAIRGWLSTDDEGHCAVVATYFQLTHGFGAPTVQLRNPGGPSDPLHAVWAQRAPTA